MSAMRLATSSGWRGWFSWSAKTSRTRLAYRADAGSVVMNFTTGAGAGTLAAATAGPPAEPPPFARPHRTWHGTEVVGIALAQRRLQQQIPRAQRGALALDVAPHQDRQGLVGHAGQ